MKSRLTRRTEQTGSQWAGGVTTELAIWPPEANFAQRTFAFRISTATVELAESTFSDFSGFTRHIMLLMPLGGQMELWHNAQAAVRLAPHEAHTFDGGWHTRSVGACTDFNLMHGPGLQGALRVVRGNDELRLAANGHTGLYALCDGLHVAGREGVPACTLNTGDFLWLDCTGEASCGSIRLTAPDPATAPSAMPAVVAVVATVQPAESASETPATA